MRIRELVVRSINLERWFPNQTLVDDRAYAPQVSLGVVVLRHDDLWGLKEQSQTSKDPDTFY